MTGPATSAGDSGLAGIVLSGGRGRRYGEPKAGVLVGGRTLVERAVTALEVYCRPVVVVSRPEVALPPGIRVPVVFDRDGPPSAINAIASGLAEVEATDVLVLACDLLVDDRLLRHMADLPSGTTAVVEDAHGWQPLCGRYPRVAALETIAHLVATGDLRARQIARLLRATSVRASPGEMTNINTPEDARAAERA